MSKAKGMSTIERLRKQASITTKKQKMGHIAFVQWKDMDDEAWVLFSLEDIFEGTKKDKGSGYEFDKYYTPAYIHVSKTGEVLRHGILSEDASDDLFFELPRNGGLKKAIDEAKDAGHTVGMMMAHEYVDDWVPKGQKKPRQFHKVETDFFGPNSPEADLLWTATDKTISEKELEASDE